MAKRTKAARSKGGPREPKKKKAPAPSKKAATRAKTVRRTGKGSKRETQRSRRGSPAAVTKRPAKRPAAKPRAARPAPVKRVAPAKRAPKRGTAKTPARKRVSAPAKRGPAQRVRGRAAQLAAKKRAVKRSVSAFKRPAWVVAREKKLAEKRAQARFEAEERAAIQAEAVEAGEEQRASGRTKAEMAEVKRVIAEKGVEWVRRDLRPAVEPTMLRHIPGASRMVGDLEDTAGTTGAEVYRAVAKVARERGIKFSLAWQMAKATGEGPFSSAFRDLALRISQGQDVPLKEVYTLFFSP